MVRRILVPDDALVCSRQVVVKCGEEVRYTISLCLPIDEGDPAQEMLARALADARQLRGIALARRRRWSG